jgi:hypothetical protein
MRGVLAKIVVEKKQADATPTAVATRKRQKPILVSPT